MAPGRKTGGGSRRGRPNRLTSAAREAWGRAWGEIAPEVAGWIRSVAEGTGEREADPARAAELALRMAEYHVPRLQQQQVTGADGGAVTVVVQTLAPTGPEE